MQKYIKITNLETKSVQVTTPGERWYGFATKNEQGLPSYEYVPSVTWILSYYPKGEQFLKFVGENGYEGANQIKVSAGDRGSIVHNACELLMKDGELNIDQLVPDRDGNPRELTPDEYEAVMTFARWYAQTLPEIVAVEMQVRSVKYGYAGTLDIVCKIDGKLGIIDIKTSKSVYPSYELQVSALKQAYEEVTGEKIEWIAILQVGYNRNKDGFKFTLIEDDFDSFLAVKRIWNKETSGERPHQRDYPMTLRLPLNPPKHV